MKLVLDTSGYAEFLRGDECAQEAVSQAEEIYLPSVVIGELLAGFACGERARENERELKEFLASPRAEVWPVTYATARRYSTVYSALRKKGKPIPTNDMWIAAASLEIGGILFSTDTHFHHIDALPRY